MSTQSMVQNPVQVPPPLPTLDTNAFRQRLACLIDTRAELSDPDWSDVRDCAVQFVAALPSVFGSNLERTTLWEKIGAAIESAYAKTAASDVDYFASSVLHSICASASSVAANDRLGLFFEWAASATEEQRGAWLSYIFTHRYAVLVRARAEWEQVKLDRKEGVAL